MENTTIEQIAATLAHELKNPIALVLANIDLLELDDTDNKNQKIYSTMRRELNNVMNIMLDFIQLSKHTEIDIEVFDINELLLQIADNCQVINKNNAEYIFDSSENCINIRADRIRLSRVFLNIYKNAVEAVENCGKIYIHTSVEDDFINVIIKDNGVGMSESTRQRIMSPFFTTKDGGSGLGIFISKIIVEEHNGIFELDSEEGKGCTVIIKLPR